MRERVCCSSLDLLAGSRGQQPKIFGVFDPETQAENEAECCRVITYGASSFSHYDFYVSKLTTTRSGGHEVTRGIHRPPRLAGLYRCFTAVCDPALRDVPWHLPSCLSTHATLF